MPGGSSSTRATGTRRVGVEEGSVLITGNHEAGAAMAPASGVLVDGDGQAAVEVMPGFLYEVFSMASLMAPSFVIWIHAPAMVSAIVMMIHSQGIDVSLTIAPAMPLLSVSSLTRSRMSSSP